MDGKQHMKNVKLNWYKTKNRPAQKARRSIKSLNHAITITIVENILYSIIMLIA